MNGLLKTWPRSYGSHLSRIRRMPARYNSKWKFTDTFFKENRPNEKVSIQSKISNYLMNIIKQESSNIVNSLTKDPLYLGDDVDSYLTKNRSLSSKLNESIDIYNKLYRLLSYNPIDIPPELYIHYYEKLEIPLDPDLQKLLIQRLLFHKEYNYFWKICLDNNISLTDLDDFIDLVYKVLSESKDQTYGISELLTYFPQELISERLGHHIMDTLCFRFNLDKARLATQMQFWNEVRHLSSSQDLNTILEVNEDLVQNSIVIQALFMKRLFQIWSEDMQDIKSKIVQIINQNQSNIFQHPGWVAMISPLRVTCMQPMGEHNPLAASPNISSFKDFLVSSVDESGSLNEVDITCIYHLHATLDPYTIYKCYTRATETVPTFKNTTIVNFLVSDILQSGINKQSTSMLSNNFKFLDYNNISKGLLKVFQEQRSEFETLLAELNQVKQNDDITAIINKLTDDVLKVEGLEVNDYLDYAYAIIKNDKTYKCFRYFFKSLQLEEDDIKVFYTSLIYSTRIQSCNTLLEINRSIMRNKLISMELISPLYEKILRNVLNRKNMNDNLLAEDFLSIKTLVGRERIVKLHNSLRAMGQTFSLLDAKEIASVLDILRKVTMSKSFSVTNNLSCQNYILDCIIDETMRFIERDKNLNRSAVFKYRDIMSYMKTSSKPVASWLFRVMVKEDTTKAVKLLNHYKDNKRAISGSVKHIISGILSSDLEVNMKLSVLTTFFDSMRNLGYRHKLKTSNALQLSKIIATNKDRLSGFSLEQINQFITEHRTFRESYVRSNDKFSNL
ncbi:hypothetical protein DFJ63DRAFT_312303 [Scheffersomyces coipomensis]|uniref:uncharacterized protein n=1 Tax=Scheffersomyces coipomensis TaxID=1788519 RepID=UPI00315D42CB